MTILPNRPLFATIWQNKRYIEGLFQDFPNLSVLGTEDVEAFLQAGLLLAVKSVDGFGGAGCGFPDQ